MVLQCAPREIMKTLRVESVDQWSDWLDEHHASESEVWLVSTSGHGCRFNRLQDALDEALCFGGLIVSSNVWMTGGTRASLRPGEQTAMV